MKTRHKKEYVPVNVQYSDNNVKTLMLSMNIGKDILYLEDNHRTHVAWNRNIKKVRVAKGRGSKFGNQFKDFDF